jgi:flagellar basal-body rod protein FlgF
MTLRRELDVIANNVANVDTVGFKVEALMVGTDTQTLPAAGPAPATVNFALDSGVARDFSQGALKQTGSTLDVALDGQGFFRVSTPNGERYTRDGRFSLDSQGRLVASSGNPVLDSSGGEITLDLSKGAPKISADGTISQGTLTSGTIGVTNFASLSALSKDGNGLYSNVSNLQPTPAPATRIRQGMIETSNVDPISQITKLIEVSRAYESISKMMDQTASLSSETINRLGQLN